MDSSLKPYLLWHRRVCMNYLVDKSEKNKQYFYWICPLWLPRGVEWGGGSNVQEGGYMHIHIADSHCHTEETNSIVIILQLKINLKIVKKKKIELPIGLMSSPSSLEVVGV